MEILGAIGGGAFVLVSFALGLRLLWLGVRRRQLAEWCLGATLFLTGGVGYPLVSICRLVPMEDGLRGALFAGFMVMQGVGIGCLALFNWRVFRPTDRRAQAATVGLWATLGAGVIGQALGPGFAASALDPQAPFTQLGNWGAAAALGWACAESWNYYRMLIRRQRLGIADPLLVDRFRLWALSSGTATVLTLLSNVGFMMGIDMATWPPGALMIGVLGLLAAGALALAFLPPAAYERRVRARSAG